LNSAIYNNLKLNTTQYQVESEFAGYLPLFKKSALKLGAQFASVYGEQIFKNELFRIGGLKTLRGTNEESIYASTYAISTIEYRFLFEQNSAIYLFADAAWYENNSINTYVTDMPYGVGAGISFETKAGIFSLNYALGKQFSNPLDIRSGKIHFGIVNSF
jgi:hemolysin activation/secretion protein